LACGKNSFSQFLFALSALSAPPREALIQNQKLKIDKTSLKFSKNPQNFMAKLPISLYIY
jgi:hypothetical protein